jgi:hypothetical protein
MRGPFALQVVPAGEEDGDENVILPRKYPAKSAAPTNRR